ncbi:glycosyltransferase family 2 protein [Shimia ponticola]|uniref:glycosyltransferase family 2 protein n=1 Tax=Shimia ponticola TaxID=2582893 RepID=UPI002106E3E8|nr:glycosyltransferase family 2 protein [Shimia ponticola]
MKNEGPYLLEWIAYHQAIGFDGFIICSNDCTDGTNLMLNRLDAMGHIIHIDNPQGPNMDPQRSAYIKIRHHPEYANAEWALVIDADEFLCVKTGDQSLDALLSACDGADAISINWKTFGSDGEAEFSPETLVTQRFTKGSTEYKPERGLFWGFKTLFKQKLFDYLGVHRPRFFKHQPMPEAGSVKWVNGSGQDTGDRYYAKGWRSGPATVGYAHAQINHYAIKSREDFLLKRLRGTANSKNKSRISMEYWEKYDINTNVDTTIPTDGLRSRIDALLEDADLAALYRASIDSARRTIDREKSSEDVVEFLAAAKPQKKEVAA